MPAPLAWVIIAVGVAFLFTLAVFVHEYGHYWVARRLGLKVDGFSIGFGPKIFSWTDRDGVVWALRWLPLGGFVKLPQMLTSEAIEGRQDDSLPPITPGKKIAVSFAGPVMNIALAFVLGSVVWWVGLPVPYNNTVIGYVPSDGREAALGIREGDRILAINDRKVRNWEDIQRTAALALSTNLQVAIQHADGRQATYELPAEYSQAARLKFLKLGPKDRPQVMEVLPGSPAEKAGLRKGDEVLLADGIELAGQQHLIAIIKGGAGRSIILDLLRDSQPLKLTVSPQIDPKDKVARIGVSLGISSRMTYTVERPGPTPWRQISNTVTQMGDLLQALAHRNESKVGVENIQGPVRIFSALAAEMKVDLRRALALMVVININLALLNLLPLPVLDGGHIVFSLIEIISRRRIPARVYETVTLAFTVLLLSLMAFVFYNDVRGVAALRSAFDAPSTVEPAPTNSPPRK